MNVAVQLLITIILTALGCQVAAALVPAGTPRSLMLCAIGGAGAVLLFNRILAAGLLGP